MRQAPVSWASRPREGVYEELEHPADLFLLISGSDLPTLFENALFALYDQMVVLSGFEARREIVIDAREASLAEALRALLVEALYRFAVDGFVAVGAEVDVDLETAAAGNDTAGSGSGADAATADVGVSARLRGEDADKRRHTLLTEIKAVTFHRLSAAQAPDGTWRATVLLDI